MSLEGIHRGLDVQAVRGTPALSPVPGTITRTWNEPAGLGQQIGVRGPDGNEIRFAHLDSTQAKPGQQVGAGEQIATVGSSGAGSTGPHLDVRWARPDGQLMDPTAQLGSMATMPRADKPVGAGSESGQGQVPINPQTGQPYTLTDFANLPPPDWTLPPLQDTLASPPHQDIPAGSFTREFYDWLYSLPRDHNQDYINPFTNRGFFNTDEQFEAYNNRANAPQLAPSQQYPPESGGRSWTERGFRFMDPSDQPITLYRGMYPNLHGDPMGNYGMTTQANVPQGAGGFGSPGAWYTDDPQLALSFYATNGRTAPRTNEEWQRLIPGLRSQGEHSASGSAPTGMDPGWMGAIQVPADRVRDLLWRPSGDYYSGLAYRDPSVHQPGAPREFIVPQDLLPHTMPRFVGGGTMGSLLSPEQIEQAGDAIREWFNPPPAGGDLYPTVPYSPTGHPQVYDTPGWDNQPTLPPPAVRDQWYSEPPVGGGQDVRSDVGVGQGQFVSPLGGGGIYGQQKWSSGMGSNATDIFVRRGSPVYAPVSGTLQQGQNGQLMLIGDNGWNFAFRHGQTTAQGHVGQGQQIGIVNDPGLDSLGQAPWGNMPDGYQHLELSVSQGSPDFPGIPGGGGNVDAAQWLGSIGYQGNEISKTPGPPDAGGGGGMFGGGMGGGFPGMMGGFPGMGGGGMDPMSMMMGGMGGMGGGFPGMSGGGMGGFPGMGGGMGMGGLGSSMFGSPMGGAGQFGGASPSFAQPSMGASMAPQVSNTTPAGVTGVPMPEIKPLDMTTMTKLTTTPDTAATPWLQNHQAPTSVTHDPTDFSTLQAPPVVGNLGTQPFQSPFWLNKPQGPSGTGQDVGAGASMGSAGMPQAPVFMGKKSRISGMEKPMFMAPRHGKLPLEGAEQTFQMMQPNHAEVNPPMLQMPRGGSGRSFRAPRPRFGMGQDVGVGQNSLTAGAQQGQTQVMIDPYSAAQLQQQQQSLQLQQQQINGQLQQINNNYQLQLAQLQQQFQLTGDSNKLEQDRQRLQDAQFHDTQQLQMRLANVQTQQNALDRNLRQQEINNQFQTQMAQIQQQWMTHQDSQLLEQQKMQLQNQLTQQSNALALTQSNKNAQLQLQLQKGTLGFQQEQLGVNANLSLEQLAAQTGLSQEQLRAQTGMGIMQLGQTAAENAANRQLQLYQSALSNPWLQDLAGLAPGYNAPGGPGETGYASAQGMQARADMSRILPNGQTPDWYTGIGNTKVNQHPGWLNNIGSTQIDTNPSWLQSGNQDYFNMIGGNPNDLSNIFPSNNGFTGNFQNTWNSSNPTPTGSPSNTWGVNPIDMTNQTWSPFQPQPLGTPPSNPTGGTTGGSSTPEFGLDFDPSGGGTMQQRPPGQNSGGTYRLPNGQEFSSQNVWDWEQANQGSSPDQAYQHFISQSYPGWNYGTNFPKGSTVRWNPMTATAGGDQGMGMQAPGQPTPSVGGMDPSLLSAQSQNYVGTGEDSGGQYLGQLPPDILSALKTNPEVGVTLVEHWVKGQSGGSSRDYVGTGSDVPFVMPFENPQYRLAGDYVGAGADDPFVDPMASGGSGSAISNWMGGGSAPGGSSSGSPGGSIQSGMDQAFGGSSNYMNTSGGGSQAPGGLTSGDYTGWGMGPVRYGGMGGYGDQTGRMQQGYQSQRYTPELSPPDPRGGSDSGMPHENNTWNPQNPNQWEGQLPNNNQGAVPSNQSIGIDKDTWYAGWRDHFGSTAPDDPYDINHDNLVDIRDWGEFQKQGNNIFQPPTPPPNPNQNFQLPVNQGTTGFIPGQLMKPPEIPQVPDWRTMSLMDPFQRSAFMTQVMMSGIPWAQYQNAMRKGWADSGGPTNTPDASRLEGLNAQRNPMQMRGQNQLADIFGEGPQAYWQRQQNQWAPGMSSGAMIAG